MGNTNRGIMLEQLESRTLFTAGGTGLEGNYFNNNNFTGTDKTRVDAQVNFNFGTGAPISGIAKNTYSIRWTGQLKPAFSEKYTFTITSDDGARLWVNHKPIIANWSQVGVGSASGSVTLVAGKKYDIQVEYRQKTGGASVQLFWQSPSTPKALVPQSRLFPGDENLKDKIDHAVAFAQGSLLQTVADLNASTSKFPSITNADGSWSDVDNTDWTSGFLAGSLWQMYQRTESKTWRLDAAPLTEALAKTDSTPDDVGFKYETTFLPLYNTLQNPADKAVLIAAANAKMATFNSKVGMFKTIASQPSDSGNPSANFMTLMDDSNDVNLLYTVGAMTNNQTMINDANSHMSKLIQTMIRPDGGTYQLGYFNASTGAFIDGETKQGLNDSSTWARGQAWAMYSLTNAYAATGRSDFLAAAEKVSDYYISHLPADFVPYWDFSATITNNTPRDTSAAAVATSAMLQLASLVKGTSAETRYLNAAEGTINSLTSSTYLAEGSTSEGILLHGAKWVAKGLTDNSLIYGDYYFLESLNRFATLSF